MDLFVMKLASCQRIFVGWNSPAKFEPHVSHGHDHAPALEARDRCCCESGGDNRLCLDRTWGIFLSCNQSNRA